MLRVLMVHTFLTSRRNSYILRRRREKLRYLICMSSRIGVIQNEINSGDNSIKFKQSELF
jgi:hypothetical protein